MPDQFFPPITSVLSQAERVDHLTEIHGIAIPDELKDDTGFIASFHDAQHEAGSFVTDPHDHIGLNEALRILNGH